MNVNINYPNARQLHISLGTKLLFWQQRVNAHELTLCPDQINRRRRETILGYTMYFLLIRRTADREVTMFTLYYLV